MAFPTRYHIVVDRETKYLTVYQRRRLRASWVRARRYRIAVGAIGFETPRGMFEITGKARNPVWRKPDSEWVPEEERGKHVPGGHPDNPLKGAFLSIWDGEDPKAPEQGIGIHGTADEESLGTEASHGCIRVREGVAIKLFEMIPVGTAVYII